MRSLRYFLLEWGSSDFWAIMRIVTSVAYYGFLTLSLKIAGSRKIAK